MQFTDTDFNVCSLALLRKVGFEKICTKCTMCDNRCLTFNNLSSPYKLCTNLGLVEKILNKKKLEKPLMLLKKKSFQTCVNYLGIYYEIITYAAQHVLVIWHMIVQNCGYLHMGCFQWTPQAAQSVREFKKELRLHFFLLRFRNFFVLGPPS